MYIYANSHIVRTCLYMRYTSMSECVINVAPSPGRSIPSSRIRASARKGMCVPPSSTPDDVLCTLIRFTIDVTHEILVDFHIHINTYPRRLSSSCRRSLNFRLLSSFIFRNKSKSKHIIELRGIRLPYAY